MTGNFSKIYLDVTSQVFASIIGIVKQKKYYESRGGGASRGNIEKSHLFCFGLPQLNGLITFTPPAARAIFFTK